MQYFLQLVGHLLSALFTTILSYPTNSHENDNQGIRRSPTNYHLIFPTLPPKQGVPANRIAPYISQYSGQVYWQQQAPNLLIQRQNVSSIITISAYKRNTALSNDFWWIFYNHLSKPTSWIQGEVEFWDISPEELSSMANRSISGESKHSPLPYSRKYILDYEILSYLNQPQSIKNSRCQERYLSPEEQDTGWVINKLLLLDRISRGMACSSKRATCQRENRPQSRRRVPCTTSQRLPHGQTREGIHIRWPRWKSLSVRFIQRKKTTHPLPLHARPRRHRWLPRL